MTYMGTASSGIGAIKDDPRAKSAMQRWTELKSDRAQFEQDWEDIARLIRPQRGGFMSGDHTKRVIEKPLSSAPIVAQSNLSSGHRTALTSKGLTVDDPMAVLRVPGRSVLVIRLRSRSISSGLSLPALRPSRARSGSRQSARLTCSNHLQKRMDHSPMQSRVAKARTGSPG